MNPVEPTDQTQSVSGVSDPQNPVQSGFSSDLPSTLPPLDQSLDQSAAAQPSAAMPVDPIAAAMPPVVPTNTQKLSPHAPAIADDVDLIEKEWVIKAKAIIKSTGNDPNKQNSEMSKFKADYLKTRYSKEIKVND